MQERISRALAFSTQPELLNSLLSLGKASSEGLEQSLVHLVKLRASQINSCAFCLHMHTAEARLDGERQVRLDVLSAWRESPVFSARERAALNWTEKLTRVAEGKTHGDDFEALCEFFNSTEIINLTAVIVTINAWNRVAVGFHFLPEIKDH